MPIIARMPVQNSPLWERTAITSVVTTAAITVTQNHAWPTEIPATYATSPAVKPSPAVTGMPARSE